MARVRAAQAPARAQIAWVAVRALVAIFSVALVGPGLAHAEQSALPRLGQQSSPAPAPVTTNKSGAITSSGAPSTSRWARVPAWQKVLGVGATLVGLAAVGGGAYLLWLDGQAGCSSSDGGCASTRHTALAGWLLVAGGTAATLGGVTLVLLPPIGDSRGHAMSGLALSATF